MIYGLHETHKICYPCSVRNMGAGRTGQGGALAPPWNFKIIIIIAYKCNMYYL